MKEKTLELWINTLFIASIIVIYIGIWSDTARWKLIATGILSFMISFLLYLAKPTPLQKNQGYHHD